MQKDTQKEEAIKEEKLRAAKLKAKERGQRHVNNCQITREKAPQAPLSRPYVNVGVGQQDLKVRALVDTGADINTISYEIWEGIGKPALLQSDIIVGSFSGEQEIVEGVCKLPVFINGSNLLHEFFVITIGQQVDSVILGQPWQREYDCCIKWKEEGINYKCNNRTSFEPFVHNTTFSKATKVEEEPEIKEEQWKHRGQATTSSWPCKQVWVPKRTPKIQESSIPQAPRQQQGTTKKIRQVWVPKGETPKQVSTQMSDKPQEKTQFRQEDRQQQVKQLWVPKALIQAQGYPRQLWIPKKKLDAANSKKQRVPQHHKKQQPKQSAKTKVTNIAAQKTKLQQIWRPK